MAKGSRPGTTGNQGATETVDAGTLSRTRAPAPGPVGLKANGGTAPLSGAALRNAIVEYARQRVGERLGSGECFDLVDRALHHAGAKSASDYGTVTANADYVWGAPVELSQVQPGDIIQFRNYSYERKVVTSTSTETREDTDSQGRPHHSAIVDQVGSDGMISVLEQNVPDAGAVQQCELFFKSFTSTSANQTTTVTVRGQCWFYRAQPK